VLFIADWTNTSISGHTPEILTGISTKQHQ
jgi:hypothetical protein